MQWKGRRQSENIEDQRGFPTKGAVLAGGGGLTLVVALIVMLLGGDPRALLEQQAQQGGGAPQGERRVNPAEEELKEFVGVVLADTEDVWNEQFRKQLNKPYREPKLRLFSREVQSACGLASAAVGPFYCPADDRVYIDLGFFEDLKSKLGAPGDFAIAYVVAHEVGHHVQNQLGFSERVHAKRNQPDHNEWSVRLELQADFLAGVWAHHAQKTKNILEQGDIEEAMRAAAAVGDDKLQREATGRVRPESFTHGTSEQRARWFRLGLKTGDLTRMQDLFEMPYGKL